MLATDAPGRQVGVREFRDHLTTLLRKAAAGQVRMAADFDASPAEILDAMEGVG